MIDLVKHIETLLLENDCVIVPGLGGFIAHYHTATFNKEKNEFNPPYRSIGFNPRLTINDGLLAQSYMQAYNTDFSDATRKIANSVEGIWQGLKVFQNMDVDVSKFQISNMRNLKRTTKKYGKIIGHRKGVHGAEILDTPKTFPISF